MLLDEYCLIPDIFDIQSYGSPDLSEDCKREICGVYLNELLEILLEEAIVRNIYGGEWRKFVNNLPSKHPNTKKKILKKLHNEKRLRLFEKKGNKQPNNGEEWCQEAIKSEGQESLTAIIASKEIKKKFEETKIVASIEKLDQINRSPSVRLEKTTNEYLRHLNLIFECSGFLKFIDPYLDPTRDNYREFYQLLERLAGLKCSENIEIHVCESRDSRVERIIEPKEYEKDFRDRLTPTIQSAQLKVKVCIWDNFHDRYLISDLIGISLPHGFGIDNSNKPRKTTWTRLGNRRDRDSNLSDREDVLNEFNPDVKKPLHQFTVG